MSTGKPILYNGYNLDSNHKIQGRVYVSELAEVYELNDHTYLYLFKSLKEGQIVQSAFEKFNVKKINVGGQCYMGVIKDEYSLQGLKRTINDITTLKGFDGVAGMESLKQQLKEEVVEPFKHPEKFKKYKLSFPNGILLYGPPGCGKTFIARKLTEEIGCTFLEISHADISSPYIHGTTGLIGDIFKKAKKQAPCIIFIDEISGLVPRRDRLDGSGFHKEEEVNEFLTQLNDARENRVLVVGATNYPERIDPAILRSGRMDKKIKVPLPDLEAREQVFKIHLEGRPLSEDINYKRLAEATKSKDISSGRNIGFYSEETRETIVENFTCSDIVLIVENAARKAMKAGSLITDKILMEIIENSDPSLSPEEIKRYEEVQ